MYTYIGMFSGTFCAVITIFSLRTLRLSSSHRCLVFCSLDFSTETSELVQKRNKTHQLVFLSTQFVKGCVGCLQISKHSMMLSNAGDQGDPAAEETGVSYYLMTV